MSRESLTMTHHPVNEVDISDAVKRVYKIYISSFIPKTLRPKSINLSKLNRDNFSNWNSKISSYLMFYLQRCFFFSMIINCQHSDLHNTMPSLLSVEFYHKPTHMVMMTFFVLVHIATVYHQHYPNLWQSVYQSHVTQYELTTRISN